MYDYNHTPRIPFWEGKTKLREEQKRSSTSTGWGEEGRNTVEEFRTVTENMCHASAKIHRTTK